MHRAVSSFNKPRILVVDDDIDTADSLAMLVELWGYSVEVARDGMAALMVATHNPPDAILLDLSMPQLDGYQVARQLRDRPAPPLLIAISGRTQPLDRILAREAGFDHYLAKPADPQEIREALSPLYTRRLEVLETL